MSFSQKVKFDFDEEYDILSIDVSVKCHGIKLSFSTLVEAKKRFLLNTQKKIDCDAGEGSNSASLSLKLSKFLNELEEFVEEYNDDTDHSKRLVICKNGDLKIKKSKKFE